LKSKWYRILPNEALAKTTEANLSVVLIFMKATGKKLKMTQIFKNNEALAITPIKLETGDFSTFKEGEKVKISGKTKGHGFEGVVKRHGFHGGPKSHGQKNRLRAPGSIGNTSPQRVLPGRKMAGHMGTVRVTIKNIKIVGLDAEKNILMLNGAVPGTINSKVEIRK